MHFSINTYFAAENKKNVCGGCVSWCSWWQPVCIIGVMEVSRLVATLVSSEQGCWGLTPWHPNILTSLHPDILISCYHDTLTPWHPDTLTSQHPNPPGTLCSLLGWGWDVVSNFAKSDLNKYCLTATDLLGEHPSPPQNMRGICLHMLYTSNHYAVDEAGRPSLSFALQLPDVWCVQQVMMPATGNVFLGKKT